MFAYDPLLATSPVSVLFSLALVEIFLAANDGNLALDPVVLPVQRERHAGHALLLGAPEYLAELALVQQHLSIARRFGDHVRGRLSQRRDMRIEQPGFFVFHKHKRVHQLALAGSQALDLPAKQDQPGLESIFDVIVVSRFLVAGDSR